jgi:hypothetical protein
VRLLPRVQVVTLQVHPLTVTRQNNEFANLICLCDVPRKITGGGLVCRDVRVRKRRLCRTAQ